jgi:FixJ family two-component response regulator
MSASDSFVYVVDDDESVRESLSRLFSSIGLAVNVFADAQSFLDSGWGDAPSVLVLDVQMPGLDGLALQRKLTELPSPPPIIFISGHADVPTSVKAMKAGAIEFLTKPFQTDELVAAIAVALERDRARHLERQEVAALRRRYDSLSPRERDVMAGVVAGRLNKQIASAFGTKLATVKEQRRHVMEKMQAASVADLVRFAARLGISA